MKQLMMIYSCGSSTYVYVKNQPGRRLLRKYLHIHQKVFITLAVSPSSKLLGIGLLGETLHEDLK